MLMELNLAFKDFAKRVSPLTKGAATDTMYVSPTFDITKDLKPGMRIKYNENHRGWVEGTFRHYGSQESQGYFWDNPSNVWATWDADGRLAWIPVTQVELA